MHPQIGAFIERRSLRSKKTLAHTENSMSNNSNIQGVGPRRSTRLNVTLGETAPPPRGSTMGTTAVTTRGEVHDTTTAVQASHSRPPHVEQLAPAAKPAHTALPAHAAQPAPVVSQAARVVPGTIHPSVAREGVFLSSSSNLSGEQNLSRQVMKLTNALAQQTTLVNQLLQRTEIQRALEEEPFWQRPGKQPINQTEQSGDVQSRLGPRDSVDSRLSAGRSVHSRLGPQVSIRSRLGPQIEGSHEQPSRQSVRSRLGPQGTYSTSPRKMPHGARRQATSQSASGSTGSPRRNHSPVRQPRQRQMERPEEQPRPMGRDLGQLRAPPPHHKQIQEGVEKLFNERLREFRRGDTTDEALRREMTKISRSPFADEIEHAEPPRKFSMPHFTSFKGDGDPERHLKHYRSAMVLYRSNDALMCKIFATTLQGEAQDWFHTLPPRSVSSFDDLSLIFTKEYSSYRSIKKKSDHLFNVKKNPKESLRDYVKRFKAEKAKIVGHDDSIASAAFQKGFPADHPLFGEMIMKEDLTLADSFALAEKHALWDEARRAEKAPEQPQKELVTTQRREDGRQPNKSRHEAKRRDRPVTRDGPTTRNYSKFSVPIHQILRNVKDEPWFKPPKQLIGDASKLDHSKYCAFHRGPGHTTENCYTWKSYLEKLVKDSKVDRYLDKPAAQLRRNTEREQEPPAKTIRINGIFAESEYLGATSSSKRRRIQQATLISQV